MFVLLTAESILFFPADQHEASTSCTYIFGHICYVREGVLSSFAWLGETSVIVEKEEFVTIEFCRKNRKPQR